MDNSISNSRSLQVDLANEKTNTPRHKSQRRASKLAAFSSTFLLVLASVFVVNISTINTAEAHSYSESSAKQKKAKKYKTSHRKKRSKRYKKRYKSKKRYKKRLKKARYSKRKGRSYKKKRRTRHITCDQLKSSILRKKARPFQKTISQASKKYGVSQNMIKAVITVETCFRTGLRGTSGEKGLMQLMPATAKRFGVKNRFSQWENIHGGTRYLSYLLRQYKGNKVYAAAAYNGGMGAVSKKTGPKFNQVRVYSRKVMNAYSKFNPLTMVKSKKRYKKSKGKRIITHRVLAGETLYSLSVRYGTTVKHIKQMNKLSSSNIATGQHLKIASKKRSKRRSY